MELDRRKFLGTLGAFVLSACVPAAFTEGSGSTATNGKDPIKSPDKPLTLDEQAKKVGLDKWISLLSQDSTIEEKGTDLSFGNTYTTTSKSIITNPDWLKNSSQLLRSNQPINEPLKVSYHFTLLRKREGSGLVGAKFLGEIEFNNIQANASPYGLSPADKANGLSVAEGVNLNFIARQRGVILKAENAWMPFSQEAALKNWLTQKDTPLGEFTQWQADKWQATIVVQKNGQWQTQLPQPINGIVFDKMDWPTGLMSDNACSYVSKTCPVITFDVGKIR